MTHIISSRTPEGDRNRCSVCGNVLKLDPSRPPGDAPCPSCGSLVWFTHRQGRLATVSEQLLSIGARLAHGDVGPKHSGFREQLLSLRARLTDGDPGPAVLLRDDGSLTITVDALGLAPDDDDALTLALIDEALERIESQTFGRCAECEGEIAKLRLQAIPYTKHCIRCATILQSGTAGW